MNDADTERLAEGVCTVLAEVGVLCQNRQILEALAGCGAEVDYPGESARFPRQIVRDFAATLRRQSAADTGSRGGQFVVPPLPALTTQVAQFFYDYERKERRSGNRDDLIYLAKLGDVLHPEAAVGHCLLVRDVPPLLEPLEAALVLAEYARRPAAAFVWKVEQIDYLLEMGAILGIDDWFEWGAICFAHPLRFDRDVADKFVRRARSGYPTGLTSMAVAGATAPVTLSGYTVLASAEHIATWIAARAINPDVPLYGSMWGGALDMKTGAVSYATFDAMLYAFAVAEFLRRWCGITVTIGGGEYCDAKLPGVYAALEKAYKALLIGAFTGRHPPIGEGMLEVGKTLSPVQLLLDRELGAGLAHLGRQIELTDEDLALDTILQVGTGLTTNYLESEPTLRSYRSSLWCPRIWDRSGWNGPQFEEAVLQKAQGQLNDLVAAYQKPAVDPDKLARMRQVVERARRRFDLAAA